MATAVPSLEQEKARLRQVAADRRAAAQTGAAGAADALCDCLVQHIRVPPGATVSGYWPMRGEIDPRPAMLALAARGHPLCLPVVAGKGQPLIFRAWRPGESLAAGGFGTQVPKPAQPEVVPQWLLVPLLAFDRAGYRLGYGGGYYDLTLLALRAAGPVVAVGLAFAEQEMQSVPHDERDARLDWVVTDKAAMRMRPAGGKKTAAATD